LELNKEEVLEAYRALEFDSIRERDNYFGILKENIQQLMDAYQNKSLDELDISKIDERILKSCVNFSYFSVLLCNSDFR